MLIISFKPFSLSKDLSLHVHMSNSEASEDHRYHHHQNHQQDTKTPSSFMATTNKPYANTSSNSFLHHQLQYPNQQEPPNLQNNQPRFPVINHNHIMKNNGNGPYDLTNLDQALSLYHEMGSTVQIKDHQTQGSVSSGMRPPTLNIFPSRPMHAVDASTVTNKITTGLGSSSSSGSRRPFECLLDNITNPQDNAPPPAQWHAPQSSNAIKVLRRLAQNRESARKSRLKKKAYVQQLESSKIKLNQLERELQRARAQGGFLGGGGGALRADQGVPLGMSNISSDAAAFDMEYAKWMDDYHRRMCELHAAVQEYLPENELRIYVDNCITHIEDVMNLKSIVVKSDVFHIISSTWKPPVERCFMWIGGFQPSELLKIVLNQIEPLSEHQLMAICEVQQSIQEAEKALSQGLDALNRSLSDTIASNALSSPVNVANYMGQMAAAMTKLTALENFVIEADNLRRQTIHQVLQLLTTRQAAKSLIAVAEHFYRLRSLNALWAARPRQD